MMMRMGRGTGAILSRGYRQGDWSGVSVVLACIWRVIAARAVVLRIEAQGYGGDYEDEGDEDPGQHDRQHHSGKEDQQ
jgi:hypothetical protein